MNKNSLIKFGPILIIVALGIFTYYNSLFNSFVWDDEFLVVDNYLIRSPRYIMVAFKTSNTEGAGQYGCLYRPIATLSYILDYSIWKLNPLGYHLVNILVHITNGLLVFFLIKLISKNKNIALLTSALFLTSPVISGVVNCVSARADLLSSMLILLCLFLFIKFRNTNFKIYYIGSLCFFLIAVFTKEIALITPFVIIFYDFTFSYNLQDKPKKIYIKEYTVYFLAILFYITVRILLFNFAAVGLISDRRIASVDLFHRLLTGCKAIFIYLRLLVLPYDLCIARELAGGNTIFEPAVFWPVQGLMLIGILAIYLYRKNKLGFFGLGWFFLTLLSYLNIYPLNAFIGEGWVYIPSIGFWFLLSLGFEKLIKTTSATFRKCLYIGLLLFLSLNICLTISRSLDWRTSITLYSVDLQKVPNSAVLHNNMGLIYFKQGRYKRAEQEFSIALETNPYYSVSHNNLGVIYVHKKLFDKAMTEYRKSIKVSPNYIAYMNLGVLYVCLKDLDLAIDTLKAAVKIAPYSPATHFYLGWVYYLKGNKREAEEEIKTAIGVDERFISEIKRLKIRTVDRKNQ